MNRSKAFKRNVEKSDGAVGLRKSANKVSGAPEGAEPMEERAPTEGNSGQQNAVRTQGREAAIGALARVRQVAKKDKKAKFTSLMHHIYSTDRLRSAYGALAKNASAGVDGETWRSYGQQLEARLEDLSGRLGRGGYRAKPALRRYIPKESGGRRPIGIPALEDKIVQRAATEVLNGIYEEDFLGFSYGFRPGRSQHDALDAVTVGITRKKVNWVLDPDIRGFFDTINHEMLVKFIEHRIGDRRVLRLIQKWLKAGVMEDGSWQAAEQGTPQGGSMSPLLANVYLHYALDLWVQRWRRRYAKGDLIFVRYADDFIVGFQYRADAEWFLRDLAARLREFSLELHPDKTRLVEFGRFAASNRQERGEGKPETFDFLGFTHYCGKSREGKFLVTRKTMRKRFQRKLRALSQQLKQRRHRPISELGTWLASVLRGYYNYYGVPGNYGSLKRFRWQLAGAWCWVLRRRSQRHRMSWERFRRLRKRWLPLPRITHPWPAERLRV